MAEELHFNGDETVEEERDLTMEEKVLVMFQRQFDKCLQKGDFFLNIVVNSEELRGLLLQFRDMTAERYNANGDDGDSIVKNVFPRTDPQILVDTTLENPITFLTMGMAEHESLHTLNIKCMEFLAVEIAPRLGLPTVTVTDEAGEQHKIAPLLYDYNMFKQAILTTTMGYVFAAQLQEFNNKNSSRIQTVGAVPENVNKILKG